MDKTKEKPVRSILRWLLLLILIGTIPTVVGAALILPNFIQTRPRWQPQVGPLDGTKLLLPAIEAHPGQPMPDDLPLDLRSGARQCWNFLQKVLARNANQYSVKVSGVFGEYGTPTGHGANEVMVHVLFPDKTRAEMYYYNDSLEVCRELP
jgi:hypothetical protein